MPPGHWHEIAVDLARAKGHSLEESAHLLALMSLAQADAAIVAWAGKYRHNFWRPLTAIRRAGEDGNEATTSNENWDSYLVAPNFPEYPSGHSTFSKAGAQILTHYYETDAVTFTARSDSVPVTRTFHSFAACADEVGLSRIYGGIHFEFANRDGKESGRKVADFVAANYLLPLAELPGLVIESWSSQRLALRMHGVVGEDYVLEATTDFIGWTELTEWSGQSGGAVYEEVPGQETGARFFRLRAIQP
jgi:hypothetical protein